MRINDLPKLTPAKLFHARNEVSTLEVPTKVDLRVCQVTVTGANSSRLSRPGTMAVIPITKSRDQTPTGSHFDTE